MVDIQSAMAEIRRRKKKIKKLECGPMPNAMAALPNIGGAVCSTPQSLANVYCMNVAQIRTAVPEIFRTQTKKSQTAPKTEPYAVHGVR